MFRHARPPRGGPTVLFVALLAVPLAACGPFGSGREATRPAPTGRATPAYLVYAGNSELGRLQVLADGGRVRRSLEVRGRFRLPAVGIAEIPDGISADGTTLVLASAVDAPVSRFAVLSTGLDRAPMLVDLAGELEFDALSPDGFQLYVVEHLAGGDDSYRVRRFDRATRKLAPEIIVDKRNAAETSMAGYPNTRVTDPRGIWVYTLYRNSDHGPFVHALNAADGYAVCLDLPRQGRGDQRLARLWALVRDRTGGRLYAVNTALGLVAEIDAAESTVVRTASFAPDRPGGGGLPAAGSVALSADGSLLLAGGGRGVVVVSTGSLSVTGRYLDGWSVDGLVASADGKLLHALSRARGQLAALDPTSGAVLGQQPAPDV